VPVAAELRLFLLLLSDPQVPGALRLFWLCGAASGSGESRVLVGKLAKGRPVPCTRGLRLEALRAAAIDLPRT
jgi:hypothetical protein